MEPKKPRFEDMLSPPLADRVRAFETWLETEPCQNDGGCIIMSNSQRMCAPCRIKLRFFHCTYNAEAYEGGPGEIPRAKPDLFAALLDIELASYLEQIGESVEIYYERRNEGDEWYVGLADPHGSELPLHEHFSNLPEGSVTYPKGYSGFFGTSTWREAENEGLGGAAPLALARQGLVLRRHMIGKTYLLKGEPVVVLARWKGNACPKNVLIQLADGSKSVRPFRGLRKSSS